MGAATRAALTAVAAAGVDKGAEEVAGEVDIEVAAVVVGAAMVGVASSTAAATPPRIDGHCNAVHTVRTTAAKFAKRCTESMLCNQQQLVSFLVVSLAAPVMIHSMAF